MLKKRKHKIKRRNTEPTVNHPLVLATGSASGAESVGATSAAYGVHAVESIPEHPVNLADICDSPTHATAVWNWCRAIDRANEHIDVKFQILKVGQFRLKCFRWIQATQNSVSAKKMKFQKLTQQHELRLFLWQKLFILRFRFKSRAQMFRNMWLIHLSHNIIHS